MISTILLCDNGALAGVLGMRVQLDDFLSTPEVVVEMDLLLLLTNDKPSSERKDMRKWILKKSGSYRVNLVYCFLQPWTVIHAIDDDTLQTIHKLWKNDAPSKVSIFGCQLLLARLPTREALANKGIIDNPRELACDFCFMKVEDINHLFFTCNFTNKVWSSIFK